MSRAVDRFQLIMVHIKDVLKDKEIKSLELDWKEMGEFSGDQVFPIIKIELK